jgi:hypothetical protein
MLEWMKNLGYPDTITSKMRFSPSSYPTLSAQVGSETEIACGVKNGSADPGRWSLAGYRAVIKLIVG